MGTIADLKEAEALCTEADNVDDPSLQNEMILNALDIYSSVCGVMSTRSIEDIETGLISLLEHLPNEGLDYIARWRDTLPYFEGEKRNKVVQLLVNFVKSPYINDHEKIYTAVTLFNHKEYHVCYKLFEEIAMSEEVQPKYQIEASKYLYYSELEEYVRLSQTILLDIISSDSFPSSWRLEQVMSFNTNTGVSTILNAGKLKFKPEPVFVYGLVNAFFYTTGNDPHDTIIAGQYLLQLGDMFLRLTGDQVNMTDEKLEQIKNDPNLSMVYDFDALKGEMFDIPETKFQELLQEKTLFTDNVSEERALRKKYALSEAKLEEIQKMVHFCNIGRQMTQKYDVPISSLTTIRARGFLDFSIDRSDLDEIEEHLLKIGMDKTNNEDVRADAFDVVRRCGRQKERANEAIALMGDENKTGLELRGRNIYTNTQNIHFFGAEDAIERFVENVVHPNKKSDTQIPMYNDVHSEIIDLIKRQIGKIVEEREVMNWLKEHHTDAPEDAMFSNFTQEEIDEATRTVMSKKKFLALKAIRRISVDTAMFTKYRMSMPDILIHVWLKIHDHQFNREEQIAMKKRLMQELVDMGGESGGGTCSTGHAGRLINAFDGKDASMKMSFGDQIQANISGRMNACIRKTSEDDPDSYDKISSGCMKDAEQDDRDFYFAFVERNLSRIREEMKDEFVFGKERYLTEEEFDRFFEKGAKGWKETL